MTLSVCVYAASSEEVEPSYRELAASLGRALAAQGWGVVYGGGGIGLMGEVARAALEAGAPVVGVIPHLLADREVALDGVTELIRTETMRERKHLMDQRADAFVILPGGIGTLEELMEILTLRQLGFHDRPIVLLDPDGYWDPLVEMFARMTERGLAHSAVDRLYAHAHDAATAVSVIRASTAGSPTGRPGDAPPTGARRPGV